MIGNELKPGDHLSLTQEDGNEIEVIVGETGIIIKASKIRTDLDVRRDSSFSVWVEAVDRVE